MQYWGITLTVQKTLPSVVMHFFPSCLLFENIANQDTFCLRLILVLTFSSKLLRLGFTQEEVVRDSRRIWIVLVPDWCCRFHTSGRIRNKNSSVWSCLWRFLVQNLKWDLTYGWLGGNLNWPIRIQQAGKTALLFSRQCKLTGKALKSGKFSHWRWR